MLILTVLIAVSASALAAAEPPAAALGQVAGSESATPPDPGVAPEASSDADLNPKSALAPGWFHLNVDDLYLEFESNAQWRTVDFPSDRFGTFGGRRDDGNQRNRDLWFRETLGFSLRGDVIDPRFIDFSGNFEVGLNQIESFERLAGLDRTSSDSGFLSKFDVNLDILREKPLSANVYARRSDNRVARRFLPSLRERVTETGFTAQALTGPVTTRFGLSYSDIERTGNRRIEDDETLSTTRFFVDSTLTIAENHTLRLQYDHERQDNTFQGSNFDFGVIRDEWRLEHDLRFGDKDQHVWSSFLRVNQETGALGRDEIVANSRLSWQWSDALRTSVRYGYFRYDQADQTVDLHKIDLVGVYQPSDEWRFTLDGFYLREEVEQDLDTDQYGAQFDVAFHKPDDWGAWNVNLAVAWDQQRTTGDVGLRTVRDEALVLDDVRPVYLRQRNAVLASIIVHDLSRQRIYVPGVDYRVIPASDRILVVRVPTGRIALGDVVYVDYLYDIPTGAQIDTMRTDLLIEHPFDCGLTPYYNFEGRFQDTDDTEGSPFLRDNQDRHRMGIRYDKTRWNAAAEYEIYDDSIEPYDAFHLTGRWNLLQTAEHQLDTRGEVSLYRFEGGVDRREVWWIDFSVTDRWQIDPFWSVSTTAAYRREDDSIDGLTNAVDLEMVLGYTRNYLSMELAVEYDLLEIGDVSDEGFGVFLRVRRDLGHLLAWKGS